VRAWRRGERLRRCHRGRRQGQRAAVECLIRPMASTTSSRACSAASCDSAHIAGTRSSATPASDATTHSRRWRSAASETSDVNASGAPMSANVLHRAPAKRIVTIGGARSRRPRQTACRRALAPERFECRALHLRVVLRERPHERGRGLFDVESPERGDGRGLRLRFPRARTNDSSTSTVAREVDASTAKIAERFDRRDADGSDEGRWSHAPADQ